MHNYLVFDGISLEHFGTFLGGAGKFEKPTREYENLQIEGKTGDLHIDKGRYTNIIVEYPIVIMDDMVKNMDAIFNFFMSRIGYKRLEDTFDPNVYMLAKFESIEVNRLTNHIDAGSFILRFDCNPKKFMKVGEKPVIVTNEKSIMNPTMYEALPLIQMTGTGSFWVNENEYILSENTGTTTIDCELREVYEGSINRNDDFTRYENNMPSLQAGKNVIACDNGVSLAITPRYWTL